MVVPWPSNEVMVTAPPTLSARSRMVCSPKWPCDTIPGWMPMPSSVILISSRSGNDVNVI